MYQYKEYNIYENSNELLEIILHEFNFNDAFKLMLSFDCVVTINR